MTQQELDAIKKKCENAQEIGLTGAHMAAAVFDTYLKDIPALLAEVERLKADYDRINNFEQSQCAKLLAENTQLRAERDAALEDLFGNCNVCVYVNCDSSDKTAPCWNCTGKDCKWQWRGAGKDGDYETNT